MLGPLLKCLLFPNNSRDLREPLGREFLHGSAMGNEQIHCTEELAERCQYKPHPFRLLEFSLQIRTIAKHAVTVSVWSFKGQNRSYSQVKCK